jgi:hypothetical protein
MLTRVTDSQIWLLGKQVRDLTEAYQSYVTGELLA